VPTNSQIISKSTIAASHLLIIRMSAMGDVAMTVPVIAALVDQYPKLKITVLTRSFFSPMFSDFPNVNVFQADVEGKHKGFTGLWRLFTELRKLGIDQVADFHNVLRSMVLKRFFRLYRTPFVQIDKGRAAKRILTKWNAKKEIVPLKTTHQRYADVLEKLGLPIDFVDVPLPAMRSISPDTQEMVKANSKRWIGVAPFAAYSGKTYPLHLMEAVISYFNETNRYKIILFGGGDEEEKQLSVWEKTYPNCVNMAQKVSFEEELALISQLDLMLAMDSGNAHLAAMFRILTVTIWGVTHPYAGFYPFGQDSNNAVLADNEQYPFIPTSVYGNKVPKGYEDVMTTISPKSVIKKIEQVLERK